MLPDKVDVSAGVCLAVAPPAIIRRATHNRFASPIFSRPLVLHAKVSPAPVVHPNSAFVITPRISLLASRSTRLLFQRHTRLGVRPAIISSPVVRRAGNLPAATRNVLPPYRCGEWTHQRAQHDQRSQISHVDLRLRFRQIPGLPVSVNLLSVPPNLNPFVTCL